MLDQSNSLAENFNALKERAKGISVLLVEDDPLIRKEYISFLGRIFDNIESHVNGLDGLTAFKSNKHNLVITDVHMPIMDGIEMTKRIKENYPTQSVLFISAFNDQEILYKSIQLSICGYIYKPLDMSQVLYTLDKMITKITMEKENKHYKEHLEDLVDKAMQVYIVDDVTSLYSLAKLQQDMLDLTQNTLAVLEIKNFKTLNDFYGYDIGNVILQETANILTEHVSGATDLLKEIKVYRVSGSHFALLSPVDGKSMQVLLESIIQRYELSELDVNGDMMYFEMTGAVVCRTEGLTLSNADIALRMASELENVIIFENDEKLLKARAQRLKCGDSIKRALLSNSIVPFYQGIVDNKTKTIKKYEALARLVLPDGEIMFPGVFLPVSKKTKTYHKITMEIVRKALHDFRDSECSLSLNLSIDDIKHKETHDFIFEQIKLFPDPSRIIFELLESENVVAYHEVKIFILELKRLGCKVAVDDFGSGFSNFEHVAKLDFDYIKIDGSLIVEIERELATRTIVEMLSDYSKKMHIKTIAEFVSSKEISQIVDAIGIDESQGYLYSQPSPHNDSMRSIQVV